MHSKYGLVPRSSAFCCAEIFKVPLYALIPESSTLMIQNLLRSCLRGLESAVTKIYWSVDQFRVSIAG